MADLPVKEEEEEEEEREGEEDAMLSDRRQCFLTFCFFPAVVPFQHGSASPGHQSHTSRKRKEEKRKRAPEGLRLSGAPIFSNKSRGHHIRSAKHNVRETDMAFSSSSSSLFLLHLPHLPHLLLLLLPSSFTLSQHQQVRL